jgi:hypothetical protein
VLPRSEEQVRAQRAAAAQRASSQTKPTIQDVSQLLVHSEPATHAPTLSRPPAPLGSDVDPTVPPKVPKKAKASANDTKGRAGGLVTAVGKGSTGTRATPGRPPHTLPRHTLFDGTTE